MDAFAALGETATPCSRKRSTASFGMCDSENADEPDYWDFLYFAANLGAAAQTSDVMITSPSMRRLVLGHTILSFLFNTTILALAVNVGAGLL